ncbi:hypothetical protein ACSBOB_07135 [Mesorhizobium sp. ASY16-5R]|jgi:transcription elongation factor Elf1|uniref:hypothetical protein n=1 Tax=Mesorhizobium sp. ASY16-5R TaxID=3445772 RepID=UPI003F9EF2A1
MQNTIFDDPHCPNCSAAYMAPVPFPSKKKDGEAACVNCGHSAPSEAWFAMPAIDAKSFPPISYV